MQTIQKAMRFAVALGLAAVIVPSPAALAQEQGAPVEEEAESYFSTISSKLYIFPSSGAKQVGENVTVSVRIDPNVNTVCTVSGNLYLATASFGSPYIKNVTAEKGLEVHELPSDSKAHFFIAIPGCATKKKKLFTVELGNYVQGEGTLSFGDITMIDQEGRPVAVEGLEGTYAFGPQAKSSLTAALADAFDPDNENILGWLAMAFGLAIIGYGVWKSVKKQSHKKKR